MNLKIVNLEEETDAGFKEICKWYYEWWGEKFDMTPTKMEDYVRSKLNSDKLPQTFIVLLNKEPVATYQLLADSITVKDVSPLLDGVYVDKKYRKKGILNQIMKSAEHQARHLNLKELYLYTDYLGLYEKYGWNFIEEIKAPTSQDQHRIQRLYKTDL